MQRKLQQLQYRFDRGLENSEVKEKNWPSKSNCNQ